MPIIMRFCVFLSDFYVKEKILALIKIKSIPNA